MRGHGLSELGGSPNKNQGDFFCLWENLLGGGNDSYKFLMCVYSFKSVGRSIPLQSYIHQPSGKNLVSSCSLKHTVDDGRREASFYSKIGPKMGLIIACWRYWEPICAKEKSCQTWRTRWHTTFHLFLASKGCSSNIGQANHPHMPLRVKVWSTTSIPTDFKCPWRKRSDSPPPYWSASTPIANIVLAMFGWLRRWWSWWWYAFKEPLAQFLMFATHGTGWIDLGALGRSELFSCANRRNWRNLVKDDLFTMETCSHPGYSGCFKPDAIRTRCQGRSVWKPSFWRDCDLGEHQKVMEESCWLEDISHKNRWIFFWHLDDLEMCVCVFTCSFEKDIGWLQQNVFLAVFFCWVTFPCHRQYGCVTGYPSLTAWKLQVMEAPSSESPFACHFQVKHVTLP